MRAPGRSIWDVVDERLDPSRVRPRVGPWVDTAYFDARGGRDYVIAANGRDLTYYRLEPDEAALLPLMDGTRTVGEVCVERLQRTGNLDVATVTNLVRLLHAGGFLTDRYVDVPAALARATRARSPIARLGRFARSPTIEWKGAEAMTRWLHTHGLRHMFSRIAMIAGLVVAGGGVAAFLSARGHTRTLDSKAVGSAFVILLALNLLLVFVHELGHAAYLIHRGRRVRGAGFRLYFGSPSFFIDSSDVLMLKRGHRIAQSLAGPYFEAIVTGAAAIALWAWPRGALAAVLYSFVTLNYFVLFLNLVPFLELDGYWALSDALRLPDLRPRSIAFLRRDMWRKLGRRERLTRPEIGILVYGTLGTIFTVFALLSSAVFWRDTFGPIITRMTHGGLFGIVLLIVLATFVAGPLFSGIVSVLVGRVRVLRAVGNRIRFRAQRGWRTEAARLLDESPLFDDLPVDVLDDLAARVRLVGVSEQTTIVNQGDHADAMYVVRAGTVEVVERHPGARGEHSIAKLGPGDAFGELGVATGARRNASVRAITRAELFAVDKGTFDRLLADRIHVRALEPTVHELGELQALPPFAHLTLPQLSALRARGAWLRVAPGESLIRQGEPGDAFYAIGSGRVDIFADDTYLRTLGPGDYFGEIALLNDGPRTATVRATTPARIFRLDRHAFAELVADALGRTQHAATAPIVFARA
ncbi:MAG TPA: cyclic nucleotide-binding domain-containing protein [Acidimicrobiia bacterium]|jgi:putative peptide zinc metalloprotease protein|nr:cyclic nucleotide-binding domain-containing protein [Acidimicrobiia bacterium]